MYMRIRTNQASRPNSLYVLGMTSSSDPIVTLSESKYEKGTEIFGEGKPADLPKFPAEDNESYGDRLNSSVLFPAFTRTTEVLAAKPFSRPINVSGVDANVESPPKPKASQYLLAHAPRERGILRKSALARA